MPQGEKNIAKLLEVTTVHHCGHEKHHFATTDANEMLQHRREEAHIYTGFGQCRDCKKENIPYKITTKFTENMTSVHDIPIYCDDCIIKINARVNAMKKGEEVKL